jgi:gallate decarboxylase subunit D
VDGNADAPVHDAITMTDRGRKAEQGSGKAPPGPKQAAARTLAGRPACPAIGGTDCVCLPFSAGMGRHRVWGSALFSVGSVSVNLLGGEAPHVGAVAVAIPRASRARPAQRSATTSVLALVGHKDDELARSMASALARRLAVTAVVTAGVHLGQAQPSDIAAVVRNARAAVQAILAGAPSVRRQTRSGS